MKKITLEEVKSLLPSSSNVDQSDIDTINALLESDERAEIVRESLLQSFSALKNSTKPQDFYHACKFVSLLNSGLQHKDAYAITFPDRVKRINAERQNKSNIHNFAYAYNNTKLVTEIKKLLLVPFNILYRDVKHKAIMSLANAIENPISTRDLINACDTLLTHLKDPEDNKLTLNIGGDSGSVIAKLNDSIQALVVQQKAALNAGVEDLKSLGSKKIVVDE